MTKYTVEVKKLPHNHVTTEGAFYATVNGSKVGENGRAFWPTHGDAKACGNRFASQAREVGQLTISREQVGAA